MNQLSNNFLPSTLANQAGIGNSCRNATLKSVQAFHAGALRGLHKKPNQKICELC
jgi:hypothetical protein